MVAVHCCNNCDERLHGFQVSALKRRVGDAQRLGQPSDLQMDIAVWGVEFATAMAESISRRIVRTLTLRTSAICSGLAGCEQVEGALGPGQFRHFARFRLRPFAGASGLPFLIFAHRGPMGGYGLREHHKAYSAFQQHNVAKGPTRRREQWMERRVRLRPTFRCYVLSGRGDRPHEASHLWLWSPCSRQRSRKRDRSVSDLLTKP
jgi:hypothetical protein